MSTLKADDQTRSYPALKLNRFHKNVNLVMNRIFKMNGFNVTREQEAILRALADYDGINQAELASRVGQERNNLSRTLFILEKKGYISRKICVQDKRNSLVFITPQGRNFHAQLFKAVEEYKNILFSGFNMEQVYEFNDYILQLTANLENFLESTEPDSKKAQESRNMKNQ